MFHISSYTSAGIIFHNFLELHSLLSEISFRLKISFCKFNSRYSSGLNKVLFVKTENKVLDLWLVNHLDPNIPKFASRPQTPRTRLF